MLVYEYNTFFLKKIQFITTGIGVQDFEEETVDDEAVRQKEYLERVVSSQKHQLKQMEKLHKLTYAKMLQVYIADVFVSWM